MNYYFKEIDLIYCHNTYLYTIKSGKYGVHYLDHMFSSR